MICPVCQSLQPSTLSNLQPGRRAIVFITVSDLIKSSTEGSCAECSLILHALTKFNPVAWTTAELSRSIELRIANAVDQPLELFHRPGSLYLELFRDVVEAAGAGDEVPQGIGVLRSVSKTSASSESLQLLKGWIADCEMNHELCRSSTKAVRQMPTRVLEINAVGNEVTLRKHPVVADYVALSYCWGKGTAVTTTYASLQQHLNGISISTLPRSIAEAISTTHKLGYRYIGIDALCIIQDDPGDWAAEAARMCDVYSNARLTIVASRAASTTEGLLGDQSFHESFALSYKGSQVRVRKALAREHADFMTLDREPFNNEPINKRAWCLQEAILSNRAIFFASSEVSWQCNEWRRCECGIGSKALLTDATLGDYRQLRFHSLAAQPHQSLDEAYTLWTDIATLFSKRSLSYETDRLPALSGLAQQFQKSLLDAFGVQDDYIAGLWRNDLPKGLLWQVDGETAKQVSDSDLHFRKPREWRAPSWSFMAVEAPVVFPPYFNLETLLELKDVVLQHIGGDKYGQLRLAEMRMRGRHITDLVARPTAQERIGSRLWALSCGDVNLGTFTRDIDESSLREEACTALLVGSVKAIDLILALVLKHTANSSAKSAYERIGVAHLGPLSYTRQNLGTDTAVRKPADAGAAKVVDAAAVVELTMV